MAHRRPEYGGPERRNGWDAGNGLLSGMPGWAKAVAVIGLPGIIALFLVWVGAKSLPAIQRDIIVLNQQQVQIQQLLVEHNRQAERLQSIMQQVCANTANRDPIKEQLCFSR